MAKMRRAGQRAKRKPFRAASKSAATDFCYVADAAPLLAHLAAWPNLRTLHRPANLEDVFLKLTGRELRD